MNNVDDDVRVSPSRIGETFPAAAVLIIDDVDATRQGLAQLLRLRGFQTCEAANAGEGLRILRDRPDIRLVVLDVMLPGASGYWFRDQQLQDPGISHVPVILFTGSTDVDDGKVPVAVEAVLRKPFSVDALLDLVNRYCAVAAQ